MNLSLTFLNWLLALAPVLVVVLLMLAFRWGGSKAGGMGWFVSILVAVGVFGARFELLAVAQVKSLLLSLDVLMIIWSALLLFMIAREAGAIDFIARVLPRFTNDRLMQSLLIGWLMASFLQGLGGFGVPVAVVAPLLVGLGFSPIQAVAMASIGHGWAVTFGSLASSFQSLIAVTGLPGETLAPMSALLLGIACFPSGWLVALIGSGWKGFKTGFCAGDDRQPGCRKCSIRSGDQPVVDTWRGRGVPGWAAGDVFPAASSILPGSRSKYGTQTSRSG